MIDDNELLTIELRNRGNEDVARLIAAYRDAAGAMEAEFEDRGAAFPPKQTWAYFETAH
jgi:hypothetical protein